MCRTEYAAGSDSYASILFAKHLPNEDAKQNGILYGEYFRTILLPNRANPSRRQAVSTAPFSR